MTIATTSPSILVAGDSVKTSFQFPFVGAAVADISVSTVSATGAVTLVPATAYSVTLNAAVTNQLWGVGGNVIYPLVGSPIVVGTYLLIQRTIPFTQSVTIQNQGNSYPQAMETALDLLEMQIQQLASRTTQYRGIWLTNTQYFAGDIVQDGAHGLNTLNYYICQTANISGVWATDLTAGDWAISALAAVPSGTLTLIGDVTGAGTSPITTTLATVNSNVGTFTNATVTVDAKGRVTAAATGSTGGTGTVTSVRYVGDGVLQSSTPSTAVTSSGNVAATLISQPANTILAGPTSGGNTTPTFRALVAADLPVTGIITKKYVSPQQTITSGGTLTLAHSMGVNPLLVSTAIVAQNNVSGFTAGDVLAVSFGAPVIAASASAAAGSITWDSTNVYVTFTVNANVFSAMVNKSTGASATFTNTDWKLVVTAIA